MATVQLQAGMPSGVLAGGSTFTFEAINPATGAAVGGVTVSNVAIFGLDVSQDVGKLEDVLPLYTPEEVGNLGR